jgi:hypothetical protein
MIYIIITTCINNKDGVKDDSHRKNRYFDSIKQILSFIENDSTIKPIIVENNGKRDTYLDDFNCDVFYTNNNQQRFRHKGKNELMDVKDVIEHYNIQDEDIIIKLSGRYKLQDPTFINLVKQNIDNYEAFIKFFNVCTLQYMFDDCVLGLFAIKSKYIKNFDYQFIRSAECEFADHVRKNVSNIMEIKTLNLECCFADDLRILNV